MFWILGGDAPHGAGWVEITSAVGTAAAAVVALSFGISESVRRRREGRKLGKLWGSAFELRIAGCIAFLDNATGTAKRCEAIDASPSMTAELAQWAHVTAACFDDQDVERLAKGIPDAAIELAAGVAAVHTCERIAQQMVQLNQPHMHAQRKDHASKFVRLASTAWKHLETARQLCEQAGAYRVRAAKPGELELPDINKRKPSH